MTTAAMGHQGSLSINSVCYPFLSESLQKRGRIVERLGIRGTRSRDVDDTRTGSYTVEGAIILQPTVAEFVALINLAMGGAALAEALADFPVIVDRVSAVFTYANCKINQFVFEASQSQELAQLTLNLVGKTEAVSGTAPAEPTSATPIIPSDLTLTLAAAAREWESLRLTIDNQLLVGRFMGSTTATDIPEQDRLVTLQAVVPYTAANSALYAQALAGAAGILAINDGTASSTLTFAKLQVPPESPSVPGKAEIMLSLNMTARKDGSTLELVIA